jgi:hypothetical protein
MLHYYAQLRHEIVYYSKLRNFDDLRLITSLASTLRSWFKWLAVTVSGHVKPCSPCIMTSSTFSCRIKHWRNIDQRYRVHLARSLTALWHARTSEPELSTCWPHTHVVNGNLLRRDWCAARCNRSSLRPTSMESRAGSRWDEEQQPH